MKVIVKKGSITSEDVDALVNPANSFGYMGGGVAAAIKRVGGREIEEEAIANAPIEIGHALATTPGSLKCRAVIHTPTMRNPGERCSEENVYQATAAALELACELGFKSLAFPGMGTGVGRLPFEKAASAMVKALKRFEESCLEKVVLVDIDEGMVSAWRKALKL